jgi:hypothetical protein
MSGLKQMLTEIELKIKGENNVKGKKNLHQDWGIIS